MKIYGHCRFSYFGISDTGREIGTPEAAFAKLWHPVRMAVRFHLMETILLPALRAQTDPDFTFVITTSKAMPAPFHDRLERVTADIPQVRILRTMKTNLTRALAPVMQEASDDHTQPAVHFRLDDDDAVCHEYVARLRRASAKVDPGGMITFPSGLAGFLDGDTARHCTFYKHSIAIGLALVAPAQKPRQPFRIQHVRLATRVPSFTDPTFPAFHYTLHSVNTTSGYGQLFHTDSAQRRRVRLLMAANPELARGAASTARADAALAQAFPQTTGAAMRDAIAASADPMRLVAAMGFPTEPFAPA
jgi:hypothetical protein